MKQARLPSRLGWNTHAKNLDQLTRVTHDEYLRRLEVIRAMPADAPPAEDLRLLVQVLAKNLIGFYGQLADYGGLPSRTARAKMIAPMPVSLKALDVQVIK